MTDREHYATNAAECGVPGHMVDGWVDWIMLGRMGGGFMQAVAGNDLASAVRRADAENLAALADTVRYLYSYAPSGCWGSTEKVRRWIAGGGLVGHPLVGRKATTA